MGYDVATADLNVLVDETNRALDAAKAYGRDKFRADAINWGDLCCVSAERYETQNKLTGLRVWIEEAAPDATRLQTHVREWLGKKGWGLVEVSTEW